MESSHTQAEKLTSLDAYVSRMPSEQENIFYLVAPRRDYAETSPYYEGFKKNGTEVLFLFSALDDFVMTNVSQYKGKRLVSIESAEAEAAAADNSIDQDQAVEVPKEQVESLRSWIKSMLDNRVTSVKESRRLVDTPAIILDHESASVRRMMRFADPKVCPTTNSQLATRNSQPNHLTLT
jgi:TNF receptor-associated protein 1